MKNLYSRLILKFIYLWLLAASFYISAQFSIVPFTKERDKQAVITIIQDDWNKLFTLPRFNQNIVDRMLEHQHPGDMAHHTKHLTIAVLYDEERLVGFITYYYTNASTSNIELLAIDKNYRSKGYGKKLIEYVMREVRSQGVNAIQLYVYTSNQSALQFYTHLGFSIKGTIPGCFLLSKSI